MSSYYGIVFPEFWTGPTGKAIRTEGKDAQILALYLMTCRHATMIGVYRLLIDDVKVETGLAMKGLARAFEALQRLGFADYDATTQHVWVREMAKFRLNLQREPLKQKDNRTKGAQNLYDRLVDNPFLGDFFDRYAAEIHLTGRRSCCHLVATPLQVALTSPSKPLVSQITESGIRDQRSGTGKSTGAARRPVENREPEVGSFALYCVIASEARQHSIDVDRSESISNITEIFKTLCAQRRLAYTSDIAARAIAAVMTKTGAA